MTLQPAPRGTETFGAAAADLPEMTPAVLSSLNWFSAAAVMTWVACGLWPTARLLDGTFTGRPALVFLSAFAVYGAALIALLALPRVVARPGCTVPVLLALAESITAIVVNVTTNRHLGGTGMGLGLVVVVGAQLPYFVRNAWIWIWILVQTVLLTWLVWRGGPQQIVEGTVFFVAAIGFQVFAAASSILALNEGRARSNLARANAELTAARELLAESSRTAERLRISRDLHDTLGHHLTALSLQLEVASRLTDGKAAGHVQQAYAITRLLLSDVRNVVSSLRETSKLNLADAIRALIIQPLDARVHLTVPDTLIVEDAARAEALLRAVQEVLTNTARHARARNLWIVLEAVSGGIMVTARDDGHGTTALSLGNGLRGMKERFEAHGGRVDVTCGADAGFELRAFLPVPSSA